MNCIFQDHIKLLLCDYRQLPDSVKYDRIISWWVHFHHLIDDFLADIVGILSLFWVNLLLLYAECSTKIVENFI